VECFKRDLYGIMLPQADKISKNNMPRLANTATFLGLQGRAVGGDFVGVDCLGH
jgi:hypothetical protein